MIPIKQLHDWFPAEVYQQFVLQLLEQNPMVTSTVREQYYTPAGKKKGFSTRKVYEGGYWGRYNQSANHPNFYIYVKKKVQGRWKVVEVISFTRFMKVLEVYFNVAIDCIIEGESLTLGGNLGFIQGMHVERNHKNKQINWGETMKQKILEERPDGTLKRKMIYYTEDSWVRVGWVKRGVKGIRRYEFVPATSKGNKSPSFRNRFARANKLNPDLKLRYPFYPYLRTAS